MSSGNGNGEEIVVPPVLGTLVERLGQGRRVSVDGIEVSNDTISDVIMLLDKVAADEGLKNAAGRGAFSLISREIAVPPSTNGGHRLGFPRTFDYRRGF